MTELPTVREELERKTIDLLEHLETRKEAGRLPAEMHAQIASAIWTLTSGLISGDVGALVAEVAKQRSAVIKISRNFIGKGAFLRLVWTSDQNGYALFSYDAITGLRTTLRISKSEIGFREKEIEALCAGLLARGYIELPFN